MAKQRGEKPERPVESNDMGLPTAMYEANKVNEYIDYMEAENAGLKEELKELVKDHLQVVEENERLQKAISAAHAILDPEVISD